MTLAPDLRSAIDGAPIAHLATVLPDGAPHAVPVFIGTYDDRIAIMTGPGSRKARNLRADPRVALSMTVPGDRFQPVVVRGRVVEWLDGDEGWAVVDRIAGRYLDQPYPRDHVRVVALIEPD